MTVSLVKLVPESLAGRFVRARSAAPIAMPPVRPDAFATAEAHSRRVRFLRRYIPVGCIIAVVLAMLGPLLNPFRAVNGDVSVSTVALQGSKLTMEQPKLSGFKKDAKAYEVVADSAVQDIKKPNIVELNKPVARIEMEKNSWARLSATFGIYDSTTEKLSVSDNVSVKTDTGMEMRLLKANIDFKAGTVLSEEPVEVDLSNGWVKSDKMQILDSGKVIVFEGRVRSEFREADQETTKQEGPQSGKRP